MRGTFKTALVAAVVSAFVAAGAAVATTQAFTLGATNRVNAPTSLTNLQSNGTTVNPVDAPLLTLDNRSTTANATPLSLLAAPNHAPFKVNTGVKVTNLNADRLDGFDSTYFLPKTGTAANSDQLGGHSSGFFLATAGTAANAAKLGGQPPSYYLPATGKAADSDTLDGLDSTSFAPKAQEAWHEVGTAGEPSFGTHCVPDDNGCSSQQAWANYGAGYNTVAFYRDSFGRVYLKGLITLMLTLPSECDSSLDYLFQLPAGYRPAATEIAATDHYDANPIGRIDIRNDGKVGICTTSPSSAGEWWTLDGISFRAA